MSVERPRGLGTVVDDYYVSVATVDGLIDDAYRWDNDFLYGVTGGAYLLNVDAYGLVFNVNRFCRSS